MPGLSGPANFGLGPLGVARGGAFDPLSQSGLKHWGEGRLLTGFSDGNAVTTLTDQSGNGNSPTQASSTLRPLYKASGPNSQPYLQFDGVDDYLACAFTLTQPSHWFLVYRVRTVGASGSHDTIADGGSGGNYNQIATDTTVRTYIYAGAVLSYNQIIANNAWAVLSVLFNGSSSEIRENGTQRASGNAGTNAGGGITLGCVHPTGRNSAIDIAASIVYSGARTTVEEQYIERGLGSLYGISVV